VRGGPGRVAGRQFERDGQVPDAAQPPPVATVLADRRAPVAHGGGTGEIALEEVDRRDRQCRERQRERRVAQLTGTDERVHSSRSGLPHRSKLHATAARNVWWRSGAPRLPLVSRPNRSSSRDAICSSDSVRTRAAASSIPSGIPSSRRQTRASTATLSAVISNPGRTAAARCRNSSRPVNRVPAPAPTVQSSSGTGSGATG
jgi:hypothetical protein